MPEGSGLTEKDLKDSPVNTKLKGDDCNLYVGDQYILSASDLEGGMAQLTAVANGLTKGIKEYGEDDDDA